MGKILFTYGGFSANQLKSRASIPCQSDITEGANYIDCGSVDIPSEIRDAIGEGSNDLGTIYLSAKVNRWSYFSPREWFLSGGVLYDRPKSNPFDMANFCGYNHNAVAPYISSKTDIYHQNVESGIDVTVYIGEIDWTLIGGISGMGVTSRVGGTVYKTTYIAIASQITWRRLLVIQSQFTLPFSSTQWITSELFFVDGANNKVANIPNIGTFQTQFIAPPISMTWGGSNTDYQSSIIVTPSAEWMIISQPSWIDHVVYRNGVMVSGVNAYISGDELRLYPSSWNSGGTRNGTVQLSEGVEISVSQLGGNPTYSYSVTGMVLSSTSATLIVGAGSIPISFYINSGLGASNRTIWYALYNNTIGTLVGSWQSQLSRDGRTVNATLGSFSSGDIAPGTAYLILVTNVDPMF